MSEASEDLFEMPPRLNRGGETNFSGGMTDDPDTTAAYWREQDRGRVEAIASGIMYPGGRVDLRQLGLARVELIRRDREDAEQQERLRRDFESALANKQLSAATDVAKATRWAMWAAAAAALGAIVQAAMAVVSYLR
jgi:hypothetical protein